MITKYKVRFWIAGKSNTQDIDLDYLQRELNFENCRSRKRADFPQGSIDAGVAGDEMSFELQSNTAKSTSAMIDLLEDKIRTKVRKIRKLCDELDLETGVIIVIHKLSDEFSWSPLSQSNIQFLSSLDAHYSLDVYNEDL